LTGAAGAIALAALKAIATLTPTRPTLADISSIGPSGSRPAGACNYWKSHNFNSLSDEAIRVILDGVRTLPTPESEIFIAHIGGAMTRVSSDATAGPNRLAV
jgi:hypothetical protein